jgi:mono/diheme cytochrome c family protein
MVKGVVLFLTLLPLAFVPGAKAETLDLGTAQKQYNKYCAKCHGADGHGDGEQGATLKQKPKAFVDATEMAKVDDEKLFETIKFGGEPVEGSKSDMPAMGKSLSDFEIRCLVAYVRNFCPLQK